MRAAIGAYHDGIEEVDALMTGFPQNYEKARRRLVECDAMREAIVAEQRSLGAASLSKPASTHRHERRRRRRSGDE